jgi:hypothetical protein
MGVYVKNGTPPFGPSLCESCVNGHVERGYRENEELVMCEATYFGHRVQFPVRECSSYTEKKRQTLRQLEKIAWIFEAKGNKRVAGFVAPGSEENDDKDIELIVSAPYHS